jgi:hypothetical protein
MGLSRGFNSKIKEVANLAKPGDPHEVMADFFGHRVQELYPDTELSYGKVIKPVGLKPDIFVVLPDGRKWVFEMVHGNRDPEKIRKNHIRYQQAGISDTWILWDDLRPKSNQVVSPEQGVFTDVFTELPAYQLTKPQQALLELWPDFPKYLYTFAIDPLDLGSKMPDSRILTAMMMGVGIYEFNGEVTNGDRYKLESHFLPLVSMQISEAGRIMFPKEDSSMDNMLEELGFDTKNYIVLDAFNHLNWLVNSPDGKKKIFETLLRDRLLSLSEDELKELGAFFQSEDAKNIQPFIGQLSQSDVLQIANQPVDPEILKNDFANLKKHIRNAPFPEVFKQILVDLIQDEILPALMVIMEIQQENSHYQAIKKN